MFRQETAIPRSPAARIIQDIHTIRNRQAAELDRLHGNSPSLADLREMADAAALAYCRLGRRELLIPFRSCRAISD